MGSKGQRAATARGYAPCTSRTASRNAAGRRSRTAFPALTNGSATGSAGDRGQDPIVEPFSRTDPVAGGECFELAGGSESISELSDGRRFLARHLEFRRIEPPERPGHRSPHGSTDPRRRNGPRRRWVLTVATGRSVLSGDLRDDNSPKNRRTTTSRYGSGRAATATRTSFHAPADRQHRRVRARAGRHRLSVCRHRAGRRVLPVPTGPLSRILLTVRLCVLAKGDAHRDARQPRTERTVAAPAGEAIDRRSRMPPGLHPRPRAVAGMDVSLETGPAPAREMSVGVPSRQGRRRRSHAHRADRPNWWWIPCGHGPPP